MSAPLFLLLYLSLFRFAIMRVHAQVAGLHPDIRSLNARSGRLRQLWDPSVAPLLLPAGDVGVVGGHCPPSIG